MTGIADVEAIGGNSDAFASLGHRRAWPTRKAQCGSLRSEACVRPVCHSSTGSTGLAGCRFESSVSASGVRSGHATGRTAANGRCDSCRRSRAHQSRSHQSTRIVLGRRCSGQHSCREYTVAGLPSHAEVAERHAVSSGRVKLDDQLLERCKGCDVDGDWRQDSTRRHCSGREG